MSLHPCAATGCGKKIGPERLMCEPHWRRVPERLQNAIMAAFQTYQFVRKRVGPAGQTLPSAQRARDRYFASVARAVEYLRDNGPRAVK